ncbi:MAG: hypothetical protein RDU14_16915 [Melioribacteraceae bacterium]|nr:hypothetical protein [Melioribacteraceae bacterium]
MDNLLKIALNDFWSFLGTVILISLPLNFILKMWNRFFRHWNIRKHGYPPSHCDADGEFPKKEEA